MLRFSIIGTWTGHRGQFWSVLSGRAGSRPARLCRHRGPLRSGNPRAGAGISSLPLVMHGAGGAGPPLTEPGHLFLPALQGSWVGG